MTSGSSKKDLSVITMSRSLAHGRYIPYVKDPNGIATWDGCWLEE
jgi:hypothetical protein